MGAVKHIICYLFFIRICCFLINIPILTTLSCVKLTLELWDELRQLADRMSEVTAVSALANKGQEVSWSANTLK